MARIDTNGINQLNENIKNPLENIYKKLESKGIFAEFADEFDFIYRFLESIETDWDTSGLGSAKEKEPEVTINGVPYKPVENWNPVRSRK
tara:strand:+ start:681 stop:950 length:270 start_codon:yes stop_codon:yes gene_type:complete